MTELLFEHTVRESPKAKHVRLKVTAQRGLEVIIPKGYDRARIPRLLENKQVWIRVALERAETTRKFFQPQPVWQVPTQIHLRAIGRIFHIEARETGSPRVRVRACGSDILELSGRINDQKACQLALARWLSRLTHEHLEPRLESLSTSTGLKCQRVFVKQQKTRWASCSRRHNISLNVRLLFLPPALVDYVLIHELCHIAVMDHSRRFWTLVDGHCSNYRKLDAHLREMWKTIPRWIAPFRSDEATDI